MVRDKSISLQLFTIGNYVLMTVLALICVLPMAHLFAMSLSDKAFVEAGRVAFLPMELHWNNYKELLGDDRFLLAFWNSFKRVLFGTAVQLFFITITAYALCREPEELRGRNAVMWFFVFPMLFSGGLIPTFLLIRDLGLLNSFWVLVIGPTAVPIFSVILMMNFYRQLPKPLYESAMIDGAGHMSILLRIFLPLSKPALATMALFSIVQHWNAWFDAMIYINDAAKWPVQTLLRGFLLNEIDYSMLTPEELERMDQLSDKGFKAAQVFIVTLPILCIYPFLQKYFVKGIVMGSVKG
jgi:putative aldouronate transport system permease protein